MNSVICLDAAHGLHGKKIKRAPDGTEEWMLNAAVCDKIEKYLSQYEVSIVRLDDVTGEHDISITDRVEKARSLKPIALISIHHSIPSANWDILSTDVVKAYTSLNVHSVEQSLSEQILYDYSIRSGFANGHSHTSKIMICNYEDYNVDKCVKITIEGANLSNPITHTYAKSDVGKEAYALSVANALIKEFKLVKKNLLSRSSEKIMYYVRKSLNDKASELFRTTDLSNAVAVCNEYNGYSVYKSNGELIHKSTYGKIPTGAKNPYLLRAVVNSVTGLYIRASEDPNSDRLGLVPYSSEVKILDRGALNQYWHVKAVIDGKPVVGYMYGKYLRLI